MGRKPWRKLWQDKLRSSPKWTRLRMADKGFWFECFQMAQEDGAMMLRPDKPLTTRDLAYEFRTRECTVQGWMDALIGAGLAEQNDGVFSLTGMAALLQVYHKRPTGVAQRDDIPTRDMLAAKGLGALSRPEGEKSLRREEREKEPPKPPKGGYTVAFEKFWKAFPIGNGGSKGNKKPAFASWKRDRLESKADELIALLPAFSACKRWRDGYVPNVSTWLNQRAYETPPARQSSDNGQALAFGAPRNWDEEFEIEQDGRTETYKCANLNGKRGLFRADSGAPGGWRFSEGV